MKHFRKNFFPSLVLVWLLPASVFAASPPQGGMAGMTEEEMKHMDDGHMSMDGMYMGDRPPGNSESGKRLAEKNCASCHGPVGINDSEDYPQLAGQDEGYLFGALFAYRCKARKSDIMNGVAGSLSDQNLADLAAYFANSEVKKP